MHFPVSLSCLLLLAPGSVLAAKKGISKELYDRLYLFSRYSAAAYDASCRKPPNGATVLKYVKVPATHVQGVLFKDDKRREVILAFRGSNALQDFQYDGMWGLMPFNSSACKGCQVHQGYNQQWNSAAQQVKSALQQAKAQYPQYQLVITGHSLGAGLASLAGTAMHDAGIKSTIYTYGQPRTGNQAFADHVDRNLGGMYRVTYKDDGIAQVPPAAKGYRHHTTEYWVTDPPSPANTWKCAGQEDKACNAGGKAGSIMGSHIQYFRKGIGNPLVPGCR